MPSLFFLLFFFNEIFDLQSLSDVFRFLCHHVGQLHELLYGQLFGALCHDFLSIELGCGRTAEYLAERHAQHLAALIEDGLHHALEEALVTSEVCHLVAGHAYDGTLLTSSLRHPKIFVKEFRDFLMPCHQHGLRINLLVQR